MSRRSRCEYFKAILARYGQDEFYDLVTFRSRADFLAEASLDQLYFNLPRPNSHKRGLTPWQIIHQLDPHLPLQVYLLPAVFLDYRLNPQGGYHTPSEDSRRALNRSRKVAMSSVFRGR